MAIANNIKLLREWASISQEQLAKIAGVSDKAVSTWETGKNEPRMGAIQKMADYFHLRKSDIIEDGAMLQAIRQAEINSLTGNKKSPPALAEGDKQLHKLIECYHALDENGKEALLAAAQGMRVAFEAKPEAKEGAS